ncbi:hypothetical protein TNCV_5136591 [Trichonephila clavipes]|nr:hypothetical protein TNCV_5136591 [Trichonephila clavipes]
MFDGLVACEVDRWRYDSGARRVWFFCTARVTNEGRKVRSGYLPFRMNASTLPITPKQSSSRDVGTSSSRFHTATVLFIMVILQKFRERCRCSISILY